MLQRLMTVTALVAALATSAQAGPLLSYDSSAAFDAAPGLTPSDRGEVIASDSANFSYHVACCAGMQAWDAYGTFESQVVRAQDGTLDFYWRKRYETRVHRDELGNGTINDMGFMVLFDFFDPRIHYDAGALVGSGGYRVEGVQVDREEPGMTATGDPGALTMYVDQPAMGVWSDWFFFDTNARHYDRGALVLAHSLSWNIGTSNESPAFRPLAAPIPEPSTWMSMATGLLFATFVARRRRGG
nr:PEP-CTERM sorting domain-containing protein [uncultured Caldimonas sp.]